MKHAVRIHPARGTGQDLAVFVPRGTGALVVLADGAGGTARGAEAAQRVIDRLTLDVDALDRELAVLGGQSTIVAIEIEGSVLRGVSVGDSEAWIVHDGTIEDLTAHQHRKPLLGDGADSLEDVADALVAAARLPGGGLQDDLSLVVCRPDAL